MKVHYLKKEYFRTVDAVQVNITPSFLEFCLGWTFSGFVCINLPGEANRMLAFALQSIDLVGSKAMEQMHVRRGEISTCVCKPLRVHFRGTWSGCISQSI